MRGVKMAFKFIFVVSGLLLITSPNIQTASCTRLNPHSRSVSTAPKPWPKSLAKPLPPYFQRWFERIGPDDAFEMENFNTEMRSLLGIEDFQWIFSREEIVQALLRVKGAEEGRVWWRLYSNGYQPEASLQKSVDFGYPAALLEVAKDALMTTFDEPFPKDPVKGLAYRIRAAQRLRELALGGDLYASTRIMNDYFHDLVLSDYARPETRTIFLPEERSKAYWVIKAGEKAWGETKLNHEIITARFNYALRLELSKNPDESKKGKDLIKKMADEGEYRAMVLFWEDAKRNGDVAEMAKWQQKILEETGSLRALPVEEDDEPEQ